MQTAVKRNRDTERAAWTDGQGRCRWGKGPGTVIPPSSILRIADICYPTWDMWAAKERNK